ncbi:MAG: response regulator transcription factor [Clostridiales bacterium]|nr:response regulator transcription factor [Clostridiales bacterium]
MKIRILIAEDDESLLNLYNIFLTKEGFEVAQATNGQKAFDILDNEHIDMILTDIMMPEMDGYEFVRLLRWQNPTIPILIITAKDDFMSKSKGFALGTDDYMTKPIDLNELLLRIRALLRRANILSQKRIQIGETVLDSDALTITHNGESVTPPQKEFYLLFKLLSYPDKIFTRMQLMDEIWGPDSDSELQTIDVHINRLRRKFQNNPDFEIMTIRGLGYKAVIKKHESI